MDKWHWLTLLISFVALIEGTGKVIMVLEDRNVFGGTLYNMVFVVHTGAMCGATFSLFQIQVIARNSLGWKPKQFSIRKKIKELKKQWVEELKA